MKRWIIYTAALVLALALWGAPAVQAQTDDTTEETAPGFLDLNGDGIDDNATRRHRMGGLGRPGRDARMWSQLTEAQQAALKEQIAGLQEEGKSWEDIRAAVDVLLEGWGIERPERTRRFASLLSEEQQAELKEAVEGLKAQEATRDQIRAAVDAKFEAWGIERPERAGRFGSLLSEEQQAELKEAIEGLKAHGATRDEIRAAIGAKFEECGIERPTRTDRVRPDFTKRGGRRRGAAAPASDN